MSGPRGARAGEPLPEASRERFESSLGADLSEVRVHTDDASAESADALGARAFATGDDIHFGAGEYDPSSADGQHLLAHEVAHTVQQQGDAPSPQAKLETTEPGDAAEVEADRAADAMTSGQSFTIAAHGPPRIARKLKIGDNERNGFYAAKIQAHKSMNVIDWLLVGSRLESWSHDDLHEALSTMMTLGERAHVYEAALVFSPKLINVQDQMREIDTEAIRIGTLYDEWDTAVKTGDWPTALVKLQVMSQDDIDRRLQPLTWEQKVLKLQPLCNDDQRIVGAIERSEVTRIAAQQKAVDDAKKAADSKMTLATWIAFVRQLNAYTADAIMTYVKTKMTLGERAHALEAGYALDRAADNVVILVESLDAEAKRIANVYKSWTDAVRDANWSVAVTWLAQMSADDMRARLALMAPEDQKHIQEAAPNDPRIQKALGLAQQDRRGELKGALDRLDWTVVVRILQGMPRDEIDKVLEPLSTPRVQTIRAIAQSPVVEACDALLEQRHVGGESPTELVVEPPLMPLPDFSSDTRTTREAAVLRPWGGSTDVEVWIRELAAAYAKKKLKDGTEEQRKTEAAGTYEDLRRKFDHAIIEYAGDWQQGAPQFSRFARFFCSDVREGMQFKAHPELLFGSHKIPIPKKGAPGEDVFEDMQGPIVKGQTYPVRPIVNLFMAAMAQNPGVTFSNYSGHGGTGLGGRGYSVDAHIDATVDSGTGFYPADVALLVIHHIKDAAGNVGADWQIVYDDFNVAATATKLYGGHVTYGGVSETSARTNWHGPLNIHLHVDIVPKGGG